MHLVVDYTDASPSGIMYAAGRCCGALAHWASSTASASAPGVLSPHHPAGMVLLLVNDQPAPALHSFQAQRDQLSSSPPKLVVK